MEGKLKKQIFPNSAFNLCVHSLSSYALFLFLCEMYCGIYKRKGDKICLQLILLLYFIHKTHCKFTRQCNFIYCCLCFTKRQMRIESVVTTEWNFTGSHFITSLYKCLLVKIFPQSLRLELFSLFQEQSGHNLAKSLLLMF